MKYPNNIFGEMLRAELEASDKISEHFRKGRRGKSVASECIPQEEEKVRQAKAKVWMSEWRNKDEDDS